MVYCHIHTYTQWILTLVPLNYPESLVLESNQILAASSTAKAWFGRWFKNHWLWLGFVGSRFNQDSKLKSTMTMTVSNILNDLDPVIFVLLWLGIVLDQGQFAQYVHRLSKSHNPFKRGTNNDGQKWVVLEYSIQNHFRIENMSAG